MSTRSAFESGQVSKSLLDVITVAFLALFGAVFVGAAGWSFFILGFVAFK